MKERNSTSTLKRILVTCAAQVCKCLYFLQVLIMLIIREWVNFDPRRFSILVLGGFAVEFVDFGMFNFSLKCYGIGRSCTETFSTREFKQGFKFRLRSVALNFWCTRCFWLLSSLKLCTKNSVWFFMKMLYYYVELYSFRIHEIIREWNIGRKNLYCHGES